LGAESITENPGKIKEIITECIKRHGIYPTTVNTFKKVVNWLTKYLFKEHESSLLSSKQPTTGHYTKPDESGSHPSNLFI
jgi:hypothetical protein